MANLSDFQKQFRQAIHSGHLPAGLESTIAKGALAASSRMQVYQNNYRATLGGLLQGIFSLSNAFVGEDFFRAIANEFIEVQPPKDPRLEQFGSDFPAFFRNSENTTDVKYVADLAAVEWFVHELQHVKTYSEDPAGAVRLQHDMVINPNLRVVESEYPILQLWMVGMGQLVPEAVHIDAGAQNVAVVLDALEVKLVVLTADELDCLKLLQEDSDVDCGKIENSLSSLVSKNIILNQIT